jgi:hypothetical protein
VSSARVGRSLKNTITSLFDAKVENAHAVLLQKLWQQDFMYDSSVEITATEAQRFAMANKIVEKKPPLVHPGHRMKSQYRRA